MLVYLYPHSSHKVWASVSSPGEQDKLIPKALSGDRWSQDRVVEGKGPKRNESMEEPEEKAGSGARRELFQFCLNSLLFRSWSISRRTCCREPPWRWWTAAPRSPSMSPPRASTGWRACWDTRLVWASHPCCRHWGVLACILTYGTVVGQALDRYRKREHPYPKSLCWRCAKGKRNLLFP